MNALETIRSDKRVVAVKDAIESGETIDRSASKVASGTAKKAPPPKDQTS